TVETPSFRAVEPWFILDGCNPFQIRAAHRAAPYMRPYVLKYGLSFVFRDCVVRPSENPVLVFRWPAAV
ncbi:hypothetical protein, partial [Neisseria elongata]